MNSVYPREPVSNYIQACSEAVVEAMKLLLQTKHLYQSVSVNFAAIRARAKSLTEVSRHRIFDAVTKDGSTIRWLPEDIPVRDQIARAALRDASGEICWRMPHIKTYCGTCKRLEPFNGQQVIELTQEDGSAFKQVFGMVYQCQSCKGMPEVFLVRRQGNKITLCGRSPMEHVTVPDAIPAPIARFYSGATVAFQSGETLAALFLLRTACEQWVRRFAEKPDDRVDAAIESYMASIPEGLRDSMPSMRDIYGTLSDAVHTANESVEVFEAHAQAVTKHFDIRRAHDLVDPGQQA
jgi:hypothetical protein